MEYRSGTADDVVVSAATLATMMAHKSSVLGNLFMDEDVFDVTHG